MLFIPQKVILRGKLGFSNIFCNIIYREVHSRFLTNVEISYINAVPWVRKFNLYRLNFLTQGTESSMTILGSCSHDLVKKIQNPPLELSDPCLFV